MRSFFSTIRSPPSPPLFPYTTLFRSHHPVGGRIEEFVGMPGGRERSGFRFAITDHTGDDEVRVVERRAEGVTERDRKSTRLNSSHEWNSYAVFCLEKKKVGVNQQLSS